MNVSEEQKKKAEFEARSVIETLEIKKERIKEKYKDETGIDRGAAELKKATQDAMVEIAVIRSKYGLPEPE